MTSNTRSSTASALRRWENVWGIWNGLTPADAEAVRRIAAIERGCAGLLANYGWEPHYYTLQKGIFASKFPGVRRTLWTLVNRMEYDIPGPQLRVPHESRTRYFDLWHGMELSPVSPRTRASSART